MGYSLSQETVDRMARYAREGRVCGFARCYSRAKYKAHMKNWYYPEQKAAGEAPHNESDMNFCKRHMGDILEAGMQNSELVSWGAY